MTNRYGKTALMYAAKRGYTDMVQLLLDNGAPLETEERYKVF